MKHVSVAFYDTLVSIHVFIDRIPSNHCLLCSLLRQTRLFLSCGLPSVIGCTDKLCIKLTNICEISFRLIGIDDRENNHLLDTLKSTVEPRIINLFSLLSIIEYAENEHLEYRNNETFWIKWIKIINADTHNFFILQMFSLATRNAHSLIRFFLTFYEYK